MLRRAALLPSLITFLSVLAVGLAFVVCQFHPYDGAYGWPCTWLTRHHGWHLFEFATSAMTGVIMIASTYALTYTASQSFFSRSRTRSHIRLSSFFVWMTVIAILLSFCDFSDAPPEWLERFTEYQFTEYQLLVVIPLLFGLGCVVCLTWSLLERAFLRILSRDAAST